MTARVQHHEAVVRRREQLSAHLVRLVLDCATLTSTGVPDEWVGLVVPGQFQSRYYTVRSAEGGSVLLDVVLHEEGLVTEWVGRPDVVGQTVTLHEPKGSFDLPEDAGWLLLVGDLTALPAMARIAETQAPRLETRAFIESPDPLAGYLPREVTDRVDVTWLRPAPDGGSRLAEVVEGLDWPDGPGYFWMAGESAQMRAVRKHLMRVRELPATAYDVMGYWRASSGRQPRAVDPGPVWRAGRAEGLSDEQIWARYDEARS